MGAPRRSGRPARAASIRAVHFPRSRAAMATQLPQVSVTAPVSPALERVQEMLFRPFDLRKWSVLGFGAWLARLGRSGFSGFNGGSWPGRRPFQGANLPTAPAALDAWLAHAWGW